MAVRFKGEFICKLDSKGRLMFPARLKGALPAVNTMNLVLKKGFEPCLNLYPQAEWDAMMDKFDDIDEFSPKARMFERSFFRGVEEVEMDRNYRFLIPKKFIVDLGFEKEVKVLGVNNRVEIWDPETLEKYVAEGEEFSELASDMMKANKNKEDL